MNLLKNEIDANILLQLKQKKNQTAVESYVENFKERIDSIEKKLKEDKILSSQITEQNFSLISSPEEEKQTDPTQTESVSEIQTEETEKPSEEVTEASNEEIVEHRTGDNIVGVSEKDIEDLDPVFYKSVIIIKLNKK